MVALDPLLTEDVERTVRGDAVAGRPSRGSVYQGRRLPIDARAAQTF